MKKILPLLLLFTVAFSTAQTKLKKADRLYDTFNYVEAAQLYDEFVRETERVDTEVLLHTATSYYKINQHRMAANYYGQAYKQDGGLMEPHISRYFRSLRSVREYDKSVEIYGAFLKKTGKTNELKRLEEEAAAFEKILQDSTASRFTLTLSEINSEYSDFGAVPYGTDKVIFSSSRKGTNKDLYGWNQQPFLTLYVASRSDYGELSRAEPFGKEIQTDLHDATIAFSPDLTTVYFTSSNVNKKRAVLDHSRSNRFQLYRGTLSNGEITNKEPLHFNGEDFSVGHPSVSPDGKYLFFVSDMPDGYGDADIYYCEIYEDGTLSDPKNAGPHINTSGNDFFPHLDEEGVFYFASNGHVGFGGLDIYKSSFDEGKKFGKAENLGKVVNTPYDDFALHFVDDQTGYLSSNRPNGKGDDDIYFFHRAPLPCDQFITGNVIDKKSREALSEVTITVRDSIGVTLATVQTDVDGNYRVEIPCDQEVSITAAKDEFVEQTKEAATGDVHGEDTDPVNFELDKLSDLIVKDEDTGVEKINLDTIYFEFDRADIRPDSRVVLDKAVEVMSIFPNMVIKIESHTDSRGSDAYNLKLSDARAKATRDYLVANGVDAQRIVSATGYGETQLLNHCGNGVNCTDEEHEFNRRSDFIVVER